MASAAPMAVVKPSFDVSSDDIADERSESDLFKCDSDSCLNVERCPQHESAEELLRHYRLGEQLGAGSFARVHLVHEKVTGEERVCKLVSTLGSRSLQPQEVFELARREVKLLRDLDHPHIVKLFEYAEDARRGELAIILEYLPGGTCLDLLNGSPGGLSETLVTRLTHQLLLALGYCHAHGVMHRDVKPDNIMLTETKPWSFPDCKLIDFGLATSFDSPGEILGTPSYISPEVIRKESAHSFASDMWSVGVTVAELLTGTNPFGKPQDFNGRDEPVIEKVLQFTSVYDLERQGAIRWSSACSEMACNFVKWLLVADPSARPSAAKARRCPWLEHQQPTPSSITSHVLKSLATYPTAPPLAAMCLYIIVARSAVPSYLGAAFLGADMDGDNRISRRDLQEAVSRARNWWDPAVDIDALFGKSGAWTFTQFATACLYGQQGSLKELVKCAFEVLDVDRDGFVSVTTILSFFPEHDLWKLQLPKGDPFTLEQWLACSMLCWKAADDESGASSPFGRFLSFYCGATAAEKMGGEQISGPTVRYTPYSSLGMDEQFVAVTT